MTLAPTRSHLLTGHYTVEVSATGFRLYKRTNIALDVSSAIVVDAAAGSGRTEETITVEEFGWYARKSPTPNWEM